MKKLLLLVSIAGFVIQANAQKVSSSQVPAASRTVLVKTYPQAKKVVWEKENGNFEGNWKTDGYDHAATFTASGDFAGSETDVDPARLPAAAREYMSKVTHTKIREASLNSDADGNKTYEADVKGKAYIFDMQGRFVKEGSVTDYKPAK